MLGAISFIATFLLTSILNEFFLKSPIPDFINGVICATISMACQSVFHDLVHK